MTKKLKKLFSAVLMLAMAFLVVQMSDVTVYAYDSLPNELNGDTVEWVSLSLF